MRLLSRTLIIFIIIGMIFFIGVRYVLMMRSGGGMIEITVPTYGKNPNVYITNSYVEKDGCIEFVDALGMKHKVCGAYSISKW